MELGLVSFHSNFQLKVQERSVLFRTVIFDVKFVYKAVRVDKGTRVGTQTGTWGHRDRAGGVQGAPGCAVNALWAARLALGDRLRVPAVNCRQ